MKCQIRFKTAPSSEKETSIEESIMAIMWRMKMIVTPASEEELQLLIAEVNGYDQELFGNIMADISHEWIEEIYHKTKEESDAYTH